MRITPYSAAAGGSLSSRRELAVGRLPRVLRQVLRLEPLPQLVDLGLVLVALAELVLDRLQLLAEEVLALALVHLRPRPATGSWSRAPNTSSSRLRIAESCPQALLDVDALEQLLPLRGIGRRVEATRCASALGSSTFAAASCSSSGRYGGEPDDPREEALDVARQRLDLGGSAHVVRHRLDLGDEVRLVRVLLAEADAVQALDEDPERPVGHLDHLVDDRRRADLVEVVAARGLGLGVLRRHEREQALAGDDVVDQPDRALLPDRERGHRLREDDRLLQRQDGQRRQLDVARRRSSS